MTPSRRGRHSTPPLSRSGARNPAREERPRRADSPVTTSRADVLQTQGETRYWLVASEIECAALMYGEISPGLRAQVADLLRPDPESPRKDLHNGEVEEHHR